MSGPPHLSLSGIDVAELRQRRMLLLVELGEGPGAPVVLAPRPWWRRLWPLSQADIERRLLADLIALEDAQRQRTARRET